MRIEREHAVDADRFEHARDVARGDGVVRLRAAVLAPEREIGDDGRHMLGTGIAQRTAEKREPTQLVAHAERGVAGERLADENVLAAHAFERADLELPVLERPLLVARDAGFELARELERPPPALVEAEELHARAWLSGELSPPCDRLRPAAVSRQRTTSASSS